MTRRSTVVVLLSLALAACQPTVEEDRVSNEETTATGAGTPMAHLCDAFDVTVVEGLAIPDGAETQVVPGAFHDGYGWCTVRLDGGRALAIEVDFADSQAAQSALADERWRSEELSVGDATGFTGRTGPADDDGGRAVLGDDERVVRVTVEPSMVAEPADARRVAGEIATVVLRTVSTQDR